LLAFTQDIDFVHYSSEQLPVLILTAGLWIIAQIHTRSQAHERWFLVLGILLGAVPFAKLQAVPQAAILGVWALWMAYHRLRFIKNAAYLIVGAGLFPLLVLGFVLSQGLYQDFVDFYLVGNLIYAGGGTSSGFLTHLWALSTKSPDFVLYLISMAALAITGLFINRKELLKRPSMMIIWVFLYFLASIYAATKSGNLFIHYLNFCILPFALLAACFIQRELMKPRLLLITGFLVALPFGYSVLNKLRTHQPLNQFVSTTDHSLPQSEVTKLVKQYAKPNEKMVVWGWMCKYYVEAQMPQGTAENHSTRCIFKHPLQDVYYHRYINDLKRNRPQIFIDAVGPNSLWTNDRTTQAHEAFPELKTFIQTNYTFVGEVENTRVYIKK